MADTGTPTLADIYKAAKEAEKTLVLDLETAMFAFEATLTDLLAAFPEEAKATVAVQLGLQMQNAVTQVKSYSLPNAKQQYGIGVPTGAATTTAPLATTTA